MSTKPKKTKIEVFLDDENIELLEKEANAQGMSRSGLARTLIMQGLRAVKEGETK